MDAFLILKYMKKNLSKDITQKILKELPFDQIKEISLACQGRLRSSTLEESRSRLRATIGKPGQSDIHRQIFTDLFWLQIYQSKYGKDLKKIMEMAIENDDLRMVKYLIQQKLTTVDCEIFIYAVIRDKIDIIRYFMNKTTINPACDNNIAIRSAVHFQFFDMIKLLLTDDRVNPTVDNNEPLSLVITKGQTKILKLLLENPHVKNIGNNIHSDLVIAIIKGYTEIIRLLLTTEKLNLVFEEDIFYFAVEKGHIEIVKLLLKDGRINPSFDDNVAIKIAIEEKHNEIAKLLLNQPSVYNSVDTKSLLKIAIQNKNFEMAKVLLKKKFFSWFS